MMYRCINCYKLCGKLGVQKTTKLDDFKYHPLLNEGLICLDYHRDQNKELEAGQK